jgi:CubicO group peptidase (beta-lactamase class C family)
MKRHFIVGMSTPLCVLFAASCAGGQNVSDRAEAPPTSGWEGVWVAEKRFDSGLQGPLTVQRDGDRWIARLQGETVTVDRRQDGDGTTNWAFAFPDDGRFEGRQARAGSAIVGHWIQGPGPMYGYPHATPVRLAPVGNDTFDGVVTPLLQQVSLNISMVPDTATSAPGTTRYRSFLRNPERNLGVFTRIGAATVSDSEIRFAYEDGYEFAVAPIAESGDRFSLMYPRFNESLTFTRRTRDNAPGFYPRRSTEMPGAFPRPVETGDGWTTTTPEASGLDAQPLTTLVRSLAAFEPTALRQPYIHGLLLAHRGKLVLEEYFHGHHRDMTHDSRSAGKSLASALLGIAVRRNALTLDQPVYSLFGGVDAFDNPDSRKAKLTVRHLVTMSSGFNCDDDDYDTPGNEDNMQNQSEQPDWYRYALNLDMIREPGAAGVYCTAGMNLVGGAIQKATGISLLRFFQEEFAAPLQIPHYEVNLSPTEEAYMGGGIRLRPRDFLKMGQLYLDGGMWKGTRIVSEQWVRESAAPQASINSPDDYGYGWWRASYDVNGQTIETYYASGNGGQLLFVVPALDLVALIQAGNYSDGRTRNAFRDQFMREAILPAALASAGASVTR